MLILVKKQQIWKNIREKAEYLHKLRNMDDGSFFGEGLSERVEDMLWDLLEGKITRREALMELLKGYFPEEETQKLLEDHN